MKQNYKFITILISIILTLVMLSTVVFAANEDATLEEAENNICKIELGEDGEVTKKLLSVDNPKKEVTLQIDIVNKKQEEETIVPSEIFLVLDNSDSMTENIGTTTRKEAIFSAAKELAKKILTEQSSTKIGVVSFSTNTEQSKWATLEDAKLVLMPTNTLSEIENAIDSIVPEGPRTNIDAGLQIAKNNFSDSTDVNKYLILLTDGVPNAAVGGPTIMYSGEVKTKTQASLQAVKDAGINIITVMTGVSKDYKPDADGNLSQEAAGKTYYDLATEIFGTESNPLYGKFYFVTDENATTTITSDVFADLKSVKKNEIKNITLVDYFPDDIIANYDYEIVEKANIGSVTAKVNTENNSITWTIETLDAGSTASFKYKLKLKEEYDEKIINVIMPTNKKVDVTYTGTDNKEYTKTSDVSPKIVLKKEKKEIVIDNTVADKEIPQTGDVNLVLVTILAVIAVLSTVYIVNIKKNK